MKVGLTRNKVIPTITRLSFWPTLQVTMTTGWLPLLLLVIVSSQSVDGQTCADLQRDIARLETLLNRKSCMVKAKIHYTSFTVANP